MPEAKPLIIGIAGRSGKITLAILCLLLISTTANSQTLAGFLANGRLQIPPVTHPLKLAEPNEIPLELHGYKVREAHGMWGYFNTSGYVEHPVNEPSIDLTVSYHPDGSAYVNFVPMRLGKLEFIIMIDFEDGGVTNARTTVEVGLPDRKPEKLIVGVGGLPDPDVRTWRLDLSKQYNRISLFTHAVYEGVKRPVELLPTSVSYKVIGPRGAPIIEVDPSTGFITALQYGHSLVEVSFQGVVNDTCILVVPDARMGADHSQCEEFRPPGWTPPPLVGGPAPVVVRRPN
jgi:hypothetical protein